MQTPRMVLTATVLDAPDARQLADFYARLLGWETEQSEEDWVVLRHPEGGPGLSFQTNGSYRRPSWPAGADDQQVMVHLDIEVDDLEAAEAHAFAAGAVPAEVQPQEAVRVYVDPAGHPFCLWVAG